MSKLYSINSKWLPDITNLLIKSLLMQNILVIKDNSVKYQGLHSKVLKKINEMDLDISIFNLTKNFKWIILGQFIYSSYHFLDYFNILQNNLFKYLKIESITFDPKMKINIFSIYILLIALTNNIPIINYYEIKDTTFIITDKITDNLTTPKIIITLNKELNKIYKNQIYILHNYYNIISIKYNNYNIYEINNNKLKIYKYFNILDITTSNNFYYNNYLLENKGLFIEDLITLPIFLLDKFINSCKVFINQYPILNSKYNKKANKLEIYGCLKLIKIYWINSNFEENIKKFNHLIIKQKKLFYIVIFINKPKNNFKVKIYYNFYFNFLTPFTNKIFNIYECLENNKSIYIKPNKVNTNIFQGFCIYKYLLLIIIVISLLFKNLIQFKNYSNVIYEYDNIEYNFPNISLENFLIAFNKKYSKYEFHYPIIIIWDPHPYLVIGNNFTRESYNLGFFFYLNYNIISFYKKNFIKNEVLNIRVIKNDLSNKIDNLYLSNSNNEILINEVNNNLILKGKCNYKFKKILDSI